MAHDRDRFATTHWTLVLAAARTDDVDGRLALATLCQRYWYPLYVFVRRRGYTPEDAEDLTQAFFTRLLAKGDVARATPTRGRFRTFLVTALQNFLVNEWDRARALKRGGGATALSLDLVQAEQRYSIEPVSAETPDDSFNRKWALTLLDRGLGQLRMEHERDSRAPQFARLAELMASGREGDSCAAAAAELNMTEGAVRVAVHRMRRRFREILRTEIAQTVDPGEVDEEIRFLIAAVAHTAAKR